LRQDTANSLSKRVLTAFFNFSILSASFITADFLLTILNCPQMLKNQGSQTVSRWVLNAEIKKILTKKK
jgi:hypothetical protein